MTKFNVGDKVIVNMPEEYRQAELDELKVALAFFGEEKLTTDPLQLFENQPQNGEVGTIIMEADVFGRCEIELDRVIGDPTNSDRSNEKSWFIDEEYLEEATSAAEAA